MEKINATTLTQMDQIADQLIAQLFAFKQAVADLRKQMAEVSTPALGNGLLSEAEVAALLNKRARAVAKRFH